MPDIARMTRNPTLLFVTKEFTRERIPRPMNPPIKTSCAGMMSDNRPAKRRKLAKVIV